MQQDTVYLLHFSDRINPHRPAQHYLGYATDLERRIAEHAAGRGARLCAVAKSLGLTFAVVRTWNGDRRKERQLKDRHNAPELCPICRQQRAERERFLATLSLAGVPEMEF